MFFLMVSGGCILGIMQEGFRNLCLSVITVTRAGRRTANTGQRTRFIMVSEDNCDNLLNKAFHFIEPV